jgi:hypothetical protein
MGLSTGAFAGIGALIAVICFVIAWVSEDFWAAKAAAIGMTVSGLSFGLWLLTDDGVEGLRASVAGAAFWGINLTLAAWAWATLIAWFEAYRRGAMRTGGGHAWRTFPCCWVAGFALLSWSPATLSPLGIGVVLAGLAVILAWKQKYPEIAAVLGVLAGVAIAAGAAFLLGLSRFTLGNIPVAWYIALTTGIIGIFMIFQRNRSGDAGLPGSGRARHGHVRTPVIIAVCGAALIIAGGQGWSGAVNGVFNRGVTTVDKTNPGDTGNPFAPAAKKIAHAATASPSATPAK